MSRVEGEILFTFKSSYQNKSCSECQQDVKNQYHSITVSLYPCIPVKLGKLYPSISVSQKVLYVPMPALVEAKNYRQTE